MSPSFSLALLFVLSFFITNGFTNVPPTSPNSNTLKSEQADLERVVTVAPTSELPLFVQNDQNEDKQMVAPTAKSHDQQFPKAPTTDSSTTLLEAHSVITDIPQQFNEELETGPSSNLPVSINEALKPEIVSPTEKLLEIFTMVAESHTIVMEKPTPESIHVQEVLAFDTSELEIRTMFEELPPSFVNNAEAISVSLPPGNEPPSSEIGTDADTNISSLPQGNEPPPGTMVEWLPPSSSNGAEAITDQLPQGGSVFLPESTPTGYELQVTIPSEYERAPSEILAARVTTVFGEVDLPGIPFEDQVIQIESGVCDTVCGRWGFPSIVSKGRGHVQCTPCYCDQACVALHNCCPDVLIRDMASHDGGRGSECVQTIPTGVNMSLSKDLDLLTMVTSCPDSTESSDTDKSRSKCDNFNPLDPKQMLPVTDRSTKITYRNIFCAQCNGVDTSNQDSFSRWHSSVKCSNGIGPLLSGNPGTSEIYRRLNSKEEVANTGCEMRYVSKREEFNKKCNNFENALIDRCNQTGKWLFYDARIERGCNMYTSAVFNTFKNLFCYLCNIAYGLDIEHLRQEVHNTGNSANSARISFEALLDFSQTYVREGSDVEEGADNLCGKHQVYDNITCQCRDVSCMEGKDLSSSKDSPNCTTAIRTNYLGYRICLQVDLEFYQDVSFIETIMSDMMTSLQFTFSTTPLSLRATAKSWCPGNNKMSLNFEIVDFYQNGLTSLHEYDKRAVGVVNNIKAKSKDWLPAGLVSHMISLKANCPLDYKAGKKSCLSDINFEVFGQHLEYRIMAGFENLENNVHFSYFRMTNLCPYVDLPANEFERVNDSIVHKATQFKMGSDQTDELDETTLRVCRDLFLSLLSSVNKSNCSGNSSQSDDFDTWSVGGIVSIISTSLSLLCLFLTFFTYLIFRSLRDASGKNIMTLTLMLFFAQTFFEFAVEQFENKMACRSFGILIHYFWLAAVFSMNACTIERFYKLCFPLRSRAFFYSNKPFVLALAYTLVSPLLIVATNILMNYETTGEIGYGSSRICYINKLYSRLFAFALPLAILLLTNLILFAVTIHAIRRQTIPGQKSASTRVGIKACVQLSFVTGLTWSLAFLYEFIPLTSLGYIFTALIGLQGVLFFYSIILNKRVIALYTGLFTLKLKGSSSGTTSGSSDSKGRKSNGITVTKKENLMYRISFGNKKGHSDTTQTSNVDSDVGTV